MKKFFFLLVFILNAVFSFGQKEDRNWVFGDSIRIDFNNLLNPTVSTINVKNYETNASYSNQQGLLQCYVSSNSLTDVYSANIMNNQNQIMENGDSVILFSTASNGAIFIPSPSDSQEIYFFHIGWNLQTNTNFLCYSIIDLSLNSGHGKVISKNIFLADSLTEHLIGIKHANGRDWWILTKKISTNKFFKYLISPNIISLPDFQSIGSISYRTEGESASSKQGDKLAFISLFGNEDVFNFNRCTGDFSNWVELGIPPYDFPNSQGDSFYGCEFSSDGNRIYISKIYTSFPYYSRIFQYTLNCSTPINTKTDVLLDTAGFILGQMQLGPDNKIYIPGYAIGGALDSSYKYLSVINNPNDSGLACSLNLFSLYLAGHYSMAGLPNMPNYNLGPIDGSACDTLGIDNPNGIKNVEHIAINIYPNPSQQELTIEILNACLPDRQGVKPKSITVTDATGKEVMKINSTKPSTQLNIATLSSGLYFVKVIEKDGSVTVKKFVKSE